MSARCNECGTEAHKNRREQWILPHEPWCSEFRPWVVVELDDGGRVTLPTSLLTPDDKVASPEART